MGAADSIHTPQSAESVHGRAARALALGCTTIGFLAAETLNIQQGGTNCGGPHRSACFPGICRENIFPVRHAVVRETQPHAHFA